MSGKTDLEVHLIFVTKYRKSCLTPVIMSRCIELIREECRRIDADIIAIRGDQQNHIHMMLRLRPTHSISLVVQLLKQKTRYHIWQQFPEMRKFYWYKDLLWSDGYFCCSVGNASKETIERYINEQGN